MTTITEELRTAMRVWASGITVVTAAHEGQCHGMTVNSFMSVSLEPATIIVSLQTGSRTHELVNRSGAFGLTFLSAQQQDISDLFAGRAEVADRFTGLQVETLATGSPLIAGGLAWLDCRITQSIDAGMNTLVLAEVVAARNLSQDAPLVYHDRGYWKLSKM